MSELKSLAVDHPYYCSETNYFSSKSGVAYETMTDFLDEFEGMNIDLNLCFRWDITENLDDDENGLGTYRAEVFLMLQRKGKFIPCMVNSVSEKEVFRFKKYAKKHWERLIEMWNPISKPKETTNE